MRAMKRIASVVLAMVMVLAMAVPVMAAGTDKYSITVKNPQAGETYTAYKIFDATYDSEDHVAYSIKSTSPAFEVVNAYSGEGLSIVLVDGTDTYKVTVEDSFKAADFAEYLKENAEALGKAAASAIASSEEAITLEVEEAGYYFVDTNIGTLADLTTAAPTVTVYDKNETPTVDKVVDDVNVYVGQTVNFTVSGKTPSTTGYDKYTYQLSDEMSEDLSFIKKLTIRIGSDEYTVGEDGVVSSSADLIKVQYTTNGFIVDFDVMKISAETEIVITYQATVLESAITEDKIRNKVTLKYSNNPNNDESFGTFDKELDLYTGSIEVHKFDGKDDTGSFAENPLSGATFVLAKKGSGESYQYYKLAEGKVEWVDDIADATAMTTDTSGKTSFGGVENGTYYLIETEAPDGYNLVTDPTLVEVKKENAEEEDDAEKEGYNPNIVVTSDIANYIGTELPSTGGMGTTIFYVVGAILILGAGILLVTNKRMSK